MEKKKHRILESVLIAFVLTGLFALVGPLTAQTWEVFDPSLCDGVVLEDLVMTASSVILELPDDGILCYRNFTLGVGASLNFQRNALNTPVYILATESIVIDGYINLFGESPTAGQGGRGGPGGFDGGVGGMVGLALAGTGHGPGGGLPGDEESTMGGHGGYGTSSSLGDPFKRGEIYGHPLLIPLVGGSGGGGSLGINDAGKGGSGGGGAILLAANNTVEVNGIIYTYAGAGGGLGSAGAARLVAPTVKGTGEILCGSPLAYGQGRIRIDTFDRSDLAIVTRGVASLGSFVVAFPDPLPGLDILHVAGEDVPANPTGGVVVQLPEGTNPMQPVRFQTRDFPEPVEVEVVAIPDSGPTSSVTTLVDGSSSVIEVQVEIPANTITHVYAWVR